MRRSDLGRMREGKSTLDGLFEMLEPMQRVWLAVLINAREDRDVAKRMGYIDDAGFPRPDFYRFRGEQGRKLMGSFTDKDTMTPESLGELCAFWHSQWPNAILSYLGIPPMGHEEFLNKLNDRRRLTQGARDISPAPLLEL